MFESNPIDTVKLLTSHSVGIDGHSTVTAHAGPRIVRITSEHDGQNFPIHMTAENARQMAKDLIAAADYVDHYR